MSSGKQTYNDPPDTQVEPSGRPSTLDRETAKADLHASTRLSLMAEELPIRVPDPAIRTRLLTELKGPERFAPHAPEVARVFALALDDAREALRLVHRPDAWLPGFWPGSQHLVTDKLREQSALIARMPPGMRIPRHAHRARELTYILDGELLEDGKQLHVSGALLDMSCGSTHELVVGGQECLVVFALHFG